MEILFELLFEGSFEIVKNRKISKWIRYPLFFVRNIFLLIIFLIDFIGILLLFRKESYSIYGGLIFILFDIVLLASGIRNFIKEYQSKKNKKWLERLFIGFMEKIVIRNLVENDIPDIADIQIERWKNDYKGIIDNHYLKLMIGIKLLKKEKKIIKKTVTL